MTHELMVLGIGDRLYLAPIEGEKLKKVMDVGTGTGICESDLAVIRHRLAGGCQTWCRTLRTRRAEADPRPIGAMTMGDLFPNAEVCFSARSLALLWRTALTR